MKPAAARRLARRALALAAVRAYLDQCGKLVRPSLQGLTDVEGAAFRGSASEWNIYSWALLEAWAQIRGEW